MEYLGYIICTQEVVHNPTKVSAISQLPVPHNAKDVQTILGMIEYYACFAHNFADLAALLSDPLKKESTWQWTEWEQSAFEGLKTAPTRTPG